MKRSMLLSALLALLAPVAFVGCGEETKIESKETVKTPEGTKTTTDTHKETDTTK